jgi:RNA polymerase sigma factor (sigma-70 family)
VDTATLLQGCRAGDRRAQQALYDQYRRAMFTLAYRLTGDFDVAGEVLQDAFLKVFRNLDQYRGTASLGSWIKTIVVRTAWRRSRTKLLEVSVAEFPTEPAALDWSHARLDAEYLERAILSLPDGYRAVFVMAEIEGYTHAEIGAALGISEGTSKSQLFYAKKRLREML